MRKVNLAEKFAAVKACWNPAIVGELNGQHVKLVKLHGEFVWHHHEQEDELFLVIRGAFRMDWKNAEGREESIHMQEGEFLIVPRGVEHRPVAEQEAALLLFEPAGTVNTGNAGGPMTVAEPRRL